MFGGLKYCIRSANNLFTLTKTSSIRINVRNLAQATKKQSETFGENGHYDIIIVGGGATGISLAGAIGNIHLFRSLALYFELITYSKNFVFF